MIRLILLMAALALIAMALAVLVLRSRNMHLWLWSYIRQWPRRRRAARHDQVVDVYFAFCDHFEPYWRRPDDETALRRVQRWTQTYPVIAGRHHDSLGRPPKHTFFYPEEEYRPRILDDLAALCRQGFGDVEVHLHHDDDCAENLALTLSRYTAMLHERHGLLRRDPTTGKILYAFIHGNWALDNSRPDGRWCGVDNELSVLVGTGCKVDMTMPSAPSDTQTRKINSIYFARGAPGARKAHDVGRDAAVGTWGSDDELLLVQGPLALNWHSRKAFVIPRIEAAEISADCLPTAHRIALWERAGIRIAGAEDSLFIKVHTHGAEERTSDALLGGQLEVMWTELERRFRDRPGYRLHYVSAWEMYEKIHGLCHAVPGSATPR